MHFATLLIVALVAQCSNADGDGSNSYLKFYERIVTALKTLNSIEQEKEITADCTMLTGPGPHDMDCLRQWWFDVGCKFPGTHAPDHKPDVNYWQGKSGEQVKWDMDMFRHYADEGFPGYAVKCYGTLDCAAASGAGPHDMDCLRQWWSEVGCYPTGTHSPEHKPDLPWWQALFVQQVKADMAAFKLYAATDSRYQLACYG